MPKPIVDSPPLLDEFAQVSLYIQHCKCIHSVEQLCVRLEPMLLCNAFFVYNTPLMLVHIPWRSDPKSTPSVTSSSYEHHHGWLPPLVIVRALVTCSTLKLNLLWCPLYICKHCSSKYWTSRVRVFKSRYGQHSNYTPSYAITKSLLMRWLCLVFARFFKGSKSSPESVSCSTVFALPDWSKLPTCHWELSSSMTPTALGFVSPQRSGLFILVHY